MAPDPQPQLDLDRQLCFPLYAASRAVTRAYGTLLAETGLTYPQYLALLALWGADGPMSVGELGARLRLDSGTLTPLLKRLESVGLVTRSRDQADERRVQIGVTEAGWALRERVAGIPLELFSTLGLEASDAAELRRLLAQVVERLDAGMIG
jgi:DNA-binding MarR family transcriptional regulator